MLPARAAQRGRRHSVSSTRCFENCPHQYFLRYVKRVRVEMEVPVHWRFGTCVHAALEAAFCKHAERKGVAKVVDMLPYREWALAALDESWERENMPVHGGEKDRAIGIVLATLQALDGGEVLGVEHKFLPTTPDGTLVVGYADLVLKLSDTAILVRDYKVRSTPSPVEDLETDFQLNLYAWAALEDFPWAEEVYVSHYYPPIQREVMVKSDPEARTDAVSRMEAVAEAIEMETAYAPRVGPECDGCVYRPQCPAWEETGHAPALRAIEHF